MSSEALQTPEVVQGELDLLTVDYMDAIRQIQDRKVTEAGIQAVQPYYQSQDTSSRLDIFTEGVDKIHAAEEEVKSHFDEECEARAARYIDPTENPELSR